MTPESPAFAAAESPKTLRLNFSKQKDNTMSTSVLILGESGTGKTCSLRNLDPAKTLLIQPVRKPLPFPSKGWKEIRAKGDGGNIFVCDHPGHIVAAMLKAPQEIVVIDDWQYILANLFMRRRAEKSFDKFTDIGGAGFDIVRTASELAPHKRVYVLAHTVTDEFGKTRIKTLGKLLDEKIVIEGMFTTVLRTAVVDKSYQFSTHNNGSDTVKSPMGMFESDMIDNDLVQVDARICEYYGIEEPTTEEESTTNEEELI